jgi:hypothetical protein
VIPLQANSRTPLPGSRREADIPELAELAEQTKRKQHRSYAAPVCNPMTEGLTHEIRVYALRHPEQTLHTIGIHFGVNQGRVSEALFGKRGLLDHEKSGDVSLVPHG